MTKLTIKWNKVKGGRDEQYHAYVNGMKVVITAVSKPGQSKQVFSKVYYISNDYGSLGTEYSLQSAQATVQKGFEKAKALMNDDEQAEGWTMYCRLDEKIWFNAAGDKRISMIEGISDYEVYGPGDDDELCYGDCETFAEAIAAAEAGIVIDDEEQNNENY